MHKAEIDALDATRRHWVPAVVSPQRDWAAVPGCRKGARFLIDGETMTPSRDSFEPFDSQLHCLEWIMSHRTELSRALPGGTVRAVRLDEWLLGLA